MRKVSSILLILCVILGYSANAAPMPVINLYRFQPTGQVFHYYSFGDECFDDIKFGNIHVNSGAIISGLPYEGIERDGFERNIVTVYGEDRITNIRYKVDPVNLDEFPTINKYAPFILTFDGQTRDTLIDNDKKEITIYYPFYKSAVGIGFKGRYTDFGIAKYSAFPNGRSGTMLTGGGGILVSNKVKDFDVIFNSSRSKEDQNACDEIIDELLIEKVDYSKETYLYVVAGRFTLVAYKWKVKLVRTFESPMIKSPKAVPSKAQFDKRIPYSSDIIFNLFNNDGEPVKVLINGSEISQPGNYAVNDRYFVLSRKYLDKFSTGDNLSITVKFKDGKTSNMKVSIVDSTDQNYVRIFNDVEKDNEYINFINSLYDRNIIKGVNGSLRPDELITDAEFYVMLSRALNFKDKAGIKYCDWAYESLKGYGIKGEDRANDAITYNEAAKLLIKILYDQINDKRIFWNLRVYDSYENNGERIYVEGPATYNVEKLNLEEAAFLFSLPMIETDKALQNVPMTRKEAAKAIFNFINIKELINTQDLII